MNPGICPLNMEAGKRFEQQNISSVSCHLLQIPYEDHHCSRCTRKYDARSNTLLIAEKSRYQERRNFGTHPTGYLYVGTLNSEDGEMIWNNVFVLERFSVEPNAAESRNPRHCYFVAPDGKLGEEHWRLCRQKQPI